MISDIIRYVERWGTKYPKKDTYKVKSVKNEKKANNDKKERNNEVDTKI
jgi:hypothetical protein